MLTKKLVTLPKLISYVLSFTTDNANKDILENVFPTQIKSNDEFHFHCLKYGESKNINDFPVKLKSIFDPYIKDLTRHGSKKTFENDINLSLYFSILSHLIKNYNKLPTKDQLNYITKLRDKLIIYISGIDVFQEQEYDKLGWVKKDIMNSLVQFKTNKLVMKVIADYLSLNIFILNVVEDRIYVVSENDYYDMFRSNIFLVFNEDIFEPLIYSDSSVLDYSAGPIKKLITVDKNVIILMDANLSEHTPIQFNLKLSNINKYSKLIKEVPVDKADEPDEVEVVVVAVTGKTSDPSIENEYEEVIPEESDANAYIKDVEGGSDSKTENPQLVFKISSKMKLDELQVIAKKLNIVLEKDKGKKKLPKTKGDLIDDINKVLKSKN